ncbi:Miniconductance mechanosensitive channel MscM [Pedobacter sp. Bi27]|uniref:mechanosensitive ion channel family protein n=1 Tax=unclassified Pedobacter TaxID=2628915 RepID=UPI001DEF1C74|nr:MULTISPECIES: mechanosensitive ion channel domain-containing protein [unclassified Pedobacter]CAH0216983.1 Miniconductance mechanosensitive channel MscM [Pedobacter sp. Bi27]CAH0230219.1 Miniconductance mechanosensitive channel MscM [Pedobacter sp. Bi36]CAH0257082.1 Miniconductance mechanosensitive channel MscM [Pedobacter sp. Bi126]
MQYIDQIFGYPIPLFFKNLIIGLIAVSLGILIKFIIHKTFILLSRWWDFIIIKSTVKHLRRPVAIFIPLLFLNFSLTLMEMVPTYRLPITKILEIALTITFALILVRTINVLEDYFYLKYDLNKENNLKERKIRTQLQFVRKFIISLIILITAAIILLSFESMRKIGAGLLTGVGIGGIIIGFAAQKSLGNLLAGFQIAFTQPIRIDDVLIVEGEWGKVEEITLTYVVVNIWDQRRLILPITYFIEKPFQNWTRVSADLLGTVFLYLDYTIPIEPMRQELSRLLDANPLWDKRVNVVQVTDSTKDGAIEVRFLMSASNSSRAFDLRCHVREAMISFIQRNYPESLPKQRLEFKKQ